MCIDYKKLNDASNHNGWPLPHIKQLLQRIGAATPKGPLSCLEMAGFGANPVEIPHPVDFSAQVTFSSQWNLGEIQWMKSWPKEVWKFPIISLES